MSQGLPVRLRVMIPAVENAIDGGAFRPGDVLVSRSGKTSEIGNTGERASLARGRVTAVYTLRDTRMRQPGLHRQEEGYTGGTSTQDKYFFLNLPFCTINAFPLKSFAALFYHGLNGV